MNVVVGADDEGDVADVVVDELRARGERVGALAVRCFRPWPRDEVRAALGTARRVVVLEKAFAVGAGGIVGQNVRLALEGEAVAPRVHDVIAGLGGRPVTSASLRRLLDDALADRLGSLTFLDLDAELVERELRRTREHDRPGPHAENMLRDLGAVGARPT